MSRILFVESNEDGTTGGSHRIMADLVRVLGPDFVPTVLFYQRNRVADELAAAGVDVRTWDAEREAERQAYRRANGGLATLQVLGRAVRRRADFLRAERIDLVHLNNSPFAATEDWLPSAWLAGVPVVAYAMGDAQRNPSARRRWLARRLAAILPLSRFVEEGMHLNRIAPERLHLAYPGVADLTLDGAAARTTYAAELDLDPARCWVVMVGNVREWKGQHVLLDALGRLPDDVRGRLAVLLVGEAGAADRAYKARLEALVAEHNLQEVVRFTGGRRDVPQLLAAADIAVHASVRPEPFGLVVLEAMRAGCAVLAANAGGPAEVLDDNCGRTHDPADPAQLAELLRTLVSDAGLRRQLGEGARRRVQDFSIDAHARSVEAVYQKVLRLA
jgi:glycosyltransferase involved in cell wall biosynthesis